VRADLLSYDESNLSTSKTVLVRVCVIAAHHSLCQSCSWRPKRNHSNWYFISCIRIGTDVEEL